MADQQPRFQRVRVIIVEPAALLKGQMAHVFVIGIMGQASDLRCAHRVQDNFGHSGLARSGPPSHAEDNGFAGAHARFLSQKKITLVLLPGCSKSHEGTWTLNLTLLQRYVTYDHDYMAKGHSVP